MAVTVHREEPKRDLIELPNGTINGTKSFQVAVNSNTNPEFDIRNHPDTPKKGDSYSPAYSGVTARQIRVKATGQNQDNMFEWIVTVEYSNNYDPVDDVESPLDIPDKIRYSSEFDDEIIYTDAQDANQDIKNSANIPTPLMTKQAMPIITYIKNVAADEFDPSIQEIVNKVNENNVTIDGKIYFRKSCYCQGINCSEVLYKNNIAYRTLTYTIKIDNKFAGLHQVKLLNQGKRELIEAPDKYKKILLPQTQQPVSVPWPLDDLGAKLVEQNPKLFTFKLWNIYKLTDFSPLGLA